MNRLPKYRAWHRETKRMCKVLYLHFAPDETLYGVMIEPGHLFDIQDVDLLQFTGLLDKHGKEIWQGDILSVDWNDARYPVHTIGPVAWDTFNASWFLGEGGWPEHDAKYNFEIIGNVYEHPQLLEVAGV